MIINNNEETQWNPEENQKNHVGTNENKFEHQGKFPTADQDLQKHRVWKDTPKNPKTFEDKGTYILNGRNKEKNVTRSLKENNLITKVFAQYYLLV